jgi:Zn-dependent protease with chaperone function
MTVVESVSASGALEVKRWPTEEVLFVFVVLTSISIWLGLVLSIFGILYAGIFAVALFVAHVLMVTHVRGSAVRLGPQQLPELHERVVSLARRAGLDPVPAAYLMQEGGALNAFATRFLRSRMIVLYSDLLDACDDDDAARDMVIGHELGHIKCGHLDWLWLLAPGMLVPFLGAAYSRARELTCDRWGRALCGDGAAAVRGLVILAAGKRHAKRVNLSSFVRQTEDLDTGWMTIGKWLSGYPPLCDRVAALEPALQAGVISSRRGALRAAALLGAGLILPVLLIVAGVVLVAKLGESLTAAGELATGEQLESAADPVFASGQVEYDLERLAVLVETLRLEGNAPAAMEEIVAAWNERFPEEEEPRDPFDGEYYGYQLREDGSALLWSSGPDGLGSTDDDIQRIVPAASDGAGPAR